MIVAEHDTFAALRLRDVEIYDLRTRLAAAEKERDEALALAYPGEHRFPDQSWKALCDAAVAARDTARAEAERLRDGNAAMRDNIEAFRDRLATIIDEEWGTQPWMDLSTLLSALSKRLFADRLERERHRAALERIADERCDQADNFAAFQPQHKSCLDAGYLPEHRCYACLARAALEDPSRG